MIGGSSSSVEDCFEAMRSIEINAMQLAADDFPVRKCWAPAFV
jgi:DNA-binding FadR family transcriptional regulator